MTVAHVRSASHDDLPAVLALYRQLNPHDPPIDPATAWTAWSALLAPGQNTVFVAVVDDILAAVCTLSVIPNLTRGGRPYALIENVVTDQGHRGQGLGRSVVTAALDAAARAGCYKVMLASGRDDGTLRFYEKCGFTRGNKAFFEWRSA